MSPTAAALGCTASRTCSRGAFLLNSAQVCTVENPMNTVSIGLFADPPTGFIRVRGAGIPNADCADAMDG